MDGKRLIIFDKDGTLVDSSPGSFGVFEILAKEQGLTSQPRERWLESLCGPFSEGIKWIFGLKDEQVTPMAIEFAKIYGRVEAYYDFKEYPGVDEVIHKLAGKYMLSVATMMLDIFAIKTFQAMDIEGCFLTIQATPMDRWVTKQELINNCLEIAGVTPAEAVMIGDCKDDLESARKAGIDFIGVTYGYGFKEEDCIREGRPFSRTPMDLLKIL